MAGDPAAPAGRSGRIKLNSPPSGEIPDARIVEGEVLLQALKQAGDFHVGEARDSAGQILHLVTQFFIDAPRRVPWFSLRSCLSLEIGLDKIPSRSTSHP